MNSSRAFVGVGSGVRGGGSGGGSGVGAGGEGGPPADNPAAPPWYRAASFRTPGQGALAFGHPLYPQLYLLLRMGAWGEAAELMDTHATVACRTGIDAPSRELLEALVGAVKCTAEYLTAAYDGAPVWVEGMDGGGLFDSVPSGAPAPPGGGGGGLGGGGGPLSFSTASGTAARVSVGAGLLGGHGIGLAASSLRRQSGPAALKALEDAAKGNSAVRKHFSIIAAAYEDSMRSAAVTGEAGDLFERQVLCMLAGPGGEPRLQLQKVGSGSSGGTGGVLKTPNDWASHRLWFASLCDLFTAIADGDVGAAGAAAAVAAGSGVAGNGAASRGIFAASAALGFLPSFAGSRTGWQGQGAVSVGAPTPRRPFELGGARGIYGLWHFAAEVVGMGKTDGWAAPPLAYRYAEMLLFSGQPESAVAHLAAAGGADCPSLHLADAVHLGLGLAHHGLLRCWPVRWAARRLGGSSAIASGGQLQQLDTLLAPVDGAAGLLHTSLAASASSPPPLIPYTS